MRRARFTRWASDRTGDLADALIWLPGTTSTRRHLERASIRLHQKWTLQLRKADQ